MSDLSGKVAFVTGASHGIGFAIAALFARNGIKVICASRTEDDLNQAVGKIEDQGGEAMAVPLDISDFDRFELSVRKGVEKFGTIDILVNNAGIVRDKLILRMKEEDWTEIMDVNLKGYFNGIKAVASIMMKNRYGRIINVTSLVGQVGNAGQSNYASSKAGIIGLTKSAAKEFASRNITVNAVAPGYIQTRLTNRLSDRVKDQLTSHIPLERIGKPEDVAHLVLFLASDEAGYITGQTISVNGGLHM